MFPLEKAGTKKPMRPQQEQGATMRDSEASAEGGLPQLVDWWIGGLVGRSVGRSRASPIHQSTNPPVRHPSCEVRLPMPAPAVRPQSRSRFKRMSPAAKY